MFIERVAGQWDQNEIVVEEAWGGLKMTRDEILDRMTVEVNTGGDAKEQRRET